MKFFFFISSLAGHPAIRRVIKKSFSFLVELAQNLVAVFLQIPFLFCPGLDPLGEMAFHVIIFLWPDLV